MSKKDESLEKDDELKEEAEQKIEENADKKSEKEGPPDEIPEASPDFSEELIALVKSDKSIAELKEELSNYHANDIANVLPSLNANERKKLYAALGAEECSDVFSYLDDPDEYINELSAEKAADIVENMDADDAVDLLGELDEEKQKQIIGLMDKDAASDVKLIAQYDEDQIGSAMTTNFISINKGLTVKQSMRAVINQAAENDNISTVYVTEENDVFYGAIDLRDLVIARSNTPLEKIISTSYPYLYASDIISECLEKIKEYAEDSLPVLDSDNRLIGALTSSDVVEAVDDDISEDYAKLAAVDAEPDYDRPVLKSVAKRLVWLTLLLVLDLFIGAYIGVFEAVIVGLPFLVFFQQMIFGMSGNVGTQSLGVTVRSLSDDQTEKERRKLIFKETRIGFFGGLITGALATVAVTAYCYFTKAAGEGFAPAALTGLCVGGALWVAMTACALCGALIPLTLKKLKVDPAVASGPLITTVNDLVSVTVYYCFALLLLAEL